MIFKEYKTEKSFLKENSDMLHQRQDINNIILGILPQTEKEKIFFRIEDNNKIDIVGIITKSERQGLIVYIENNIISYESCEFLVKEILKRKIELKEVRAPKGIAETIADIYINKTNKKIKIQKINFLMKLNKLNEKYNRYGILRKAEQKDLEYIKEAVLDIYAETLGEDCSEENAYEIAKIYIEKGLYFLVDENENILSQVMIARTFNNGCAIGAIYTPIKYRGNGYAKTCMYKVIKQVLDENKDIVVLYSNANKPHNRSIYESIGFEIILEESLVKFE